MSDNTDTRPSHEQGQENSHQNLDVKDQKSFANKLDQAAKQEKREQAEEEAKAEEKPTDAARKNGNEPSRGAKIDEEIERAEQEELERKGKA